MNSCSIAISVIRYDQALPLAVASESCWLHPLERVCWQRLRSPLRQQQWLAGRWWLKRQLLERWNLAVAPREVQIVSRDARNCGIAPRAYIDDAPLPFALSLSHSDDYIAAAIGPGEPGSCGVDVVDQDLNNPAALRTWIMDEETSNCSELQSVPLPTAWAAKEAIFKTLAGEPFRPRRIALHLASQPTWQWSYRRSHDLVRGNVEVREHSRFVLAIANRYTAC